MHKIIQNKKEEYGEDYQNHLIGQYNLYLQGIDKASDRRQRTNDFFLAINTASLAFVGVMNKIGENIFPLIIVVSLVGIMISVIWFNLIQSYRNINRSKYQILHKIEEFLPVSPYKTEWDVLKKEKYQPITQVEIVVPVIFIILYTLIILTFLFLFN